MLNYILLKLQVNLFPTPYLLSMIMAKIIDMVTDRGEGTCEVGFFHSPQVDHWIIMMKIMAQIIDLVINCGGAHVKGGFRPFIPSQPINQHDR